MYDFILARVYPIKIKVHLNYFNCIVKLTHNKIDKIKKLNSTNDNFGYKLFQFTKMSRTSDNFGYKFR